MGQGKGKIYGLVAASFVAAGLLLFNNCQGTGGSSDKAHDPIVGKLPIEDENLVRESVPEDSEAEFCAREQIRCSHYIYGPGLEPGQSEKQICDEAGSCLSLEEIVYNTENAIADCAGCTEADLEPGGRFNYDEVQCWHQGIQIFTGKVVSIEAPSIDEATDLVIQDCMSTLTGER